MSTHVRSRFALRTPIALLSLGLLCFSGMASAYEAGTEYVKGQITTVTEDDTHVVSSQRIDATREPITLDKDDTHLVLGTKSITDKLKNATTSYRTEVIRKDTSLTLAVTDPATGRLLESFLFPAAGPGCGGQEFDTINACIKAFNCDKGAELLCEANRTCKPQLAGITCCLKDGTAVSVHLIIKPTSIKCQLLDHAVDLEGFVLSKD